MVEAEGIKDRLKKISDCVYELPIEGNMKVPARFFLSEKLLAQVEDTAIKQAANVATLPGILKHSIAMADCHSGYGFPIGGVAAFDAEKGIISPGGIGYDINCGVRLLRTPFKKEEIEPKIDELLQKLFKYVPSGVGVSSEFKLTHEELDKVMKKGVMWAIENGYGRKEDAEFCEEEGQFKNANPDNISPKAKKRGKNQLGTLGAGNHFLEIQYVEKIFNKEAAELFGLEEGKVVIMIHCGSRGLGHQVCSDSLREMEKAYPDIIAGLADRELVYAPAQSDLAKKYFSAMQAAANFAFCNRHMITHQTRKAFKEVMGNDELDLVYDIAHNICKLESHNIDGKQVKVFVHRKGATRSFPPGSKEIPDKYKPVGQPVFIPGSMGTGSYVLVGTKDAMKESFGSTQHGAGRTMSRTKAKKEFKAEDVKQDLLKKGIHVKAASFKGVVEEAPGAYKDIDEVVEVSDHTHIGKVVARLAPIGVIKG